MDSNDRISNLRTTPLRAGQMPRRDECKLMRNQCIDDLWLDGLSKLLTVHWQSWLSAHIWAHFGDCIALQRGRVRSNVADKFVQVTVEGRSAGIDSSTNGRSKPRGPLFLRSRRRYARTDLPSKIRAEQSVEKSTYATRTLGRCRRPYDRRRQSRHCELRVQRHGPGSDSRHSQSRRMPSRQ